MSIRNWPKSEQPREKLLHQGAHALSDAELLAIFLRTGTKQFSAITLARHLLKKFQGWRGLLNLQHREFCQQHGLGNVAYIQLQACLELAARYIAEPWTQQSIFTQPDDVKRYFLLRYAIFKQQEVFSCLFLNSKNEMIRFESLFFGTFNRATIYPRECARLALHYNAAAIIIAHNHPSGSPQPSAADKHSTQLIKRALSTIDVKLFDHIIIGHQQCISFAELGLL